MATLGKYEYKI